MASLRSWSFSVLSFFVFVLASRWSSGYALPILISSTVALYFIWKYVLMVPSLKGLAPLIEEAAAAQAAEAEAARAEAKVAASAEPAPGREPSCPEAALGPEEPVTSAELEAAEDEPLLAPPVAAALPAQREASEATGAADSLPSAEPESVVEPSSTGEASLPSKHKGDGWGDSSDDGEEAAKVEEDFCDPERARELKVEGNEFFKAAKLHDAREAYSEALHLMPESEAKERAVLFANRAAVYSKWERWEDVITDCKEAVKLDPEYVKAYSRRSIAFERTEKWHDANEDLKKAMELDPEIKSREYRRQAVLEKRAAEQFDKDKDEMMGKLKDLGNMVLGKFGMSVDNFQLEQDKDTGSYSVKYNNGS